MRQDPFDFFSFLIRNIADSENLKLPLPYLPHFVGVKILHSKAGNILPSRLKKKVF